MKKLKKILVSILSVVGAVCACACLSACSKKKDGNSGNGGWNSYDGVNVGFVSEADYSYDGEIVETKFFPELNCNIGEKYYMVVDFEIQAEYDNDGGDTVTAEVNVRPATALAATIQDTNTGNVSEEVNGGVKEIKATYKIPEKAETVRNMRLVIQFEALKGSEAYVDISFKTDSNMQVIKTPQIKKTANVGYTPGLVYELSKNTYTVTGWNDKTEGKLVLPLMKDGYEVTAISSEILCERDEPVVKTTAEAGSVFVLKNNCLLSEDETLVIFGCKSATVPDGVTGISENAFSGCKDITEITVHGSVTYIGGGAFGGCDNIASITLPFAGESRAAAENTSFKYIFGGVVPSSLKEVTLTDVSEIKDGAFSGCDEVEYINIPDGVTKIGDSAFKGCDSLKNFVVPSKLSGFTYGFLSYCESLESITMNGSNAYYRCEGNCLISGSDDYAVVAAGCKNSVIPKGIKRIGYCSFAGSGITELTIPDGVTHIEDSAFDSCAALLRLTVPQSVTDIGWAAFLGCNALTVYCEAAEKPQTWGSRWNDCYLGGTGGKIPVVWNYKSNAVDGDGYRYEIIDGIKYAIKGDEAVVTGQSASLSGNIEIPYKVANAYKVVGIADRAFYNCKYITGITLPWGITSLGYGVFNGCRGLKSVSIPDSVTSIGKWAFGNCEKLKSIEIPNCIEIISDDAFEDCESLERVAIPDSVKTIGARAFYGCTGLTSVGVGSGVTEIGAAAFKGCNSLSKVNVKDLSAWCKINFVHERDIAQSNPLGWAENLYVNGELVTDLVIPPDVQSVGDSAFAYCKSINSVTVNAGVNIGYKSFYMCENVTEVIISGGVQSVGDSAFAFCKNINSVSFGSGVKSLGDSAFFACENLSCINYAGTIEEWNAVEKGKNWAYYCATNLTVRCSDGELKIG